MASSASESMGCHESSSHSSSSHSDDALKLFASAPWWLYCTSWKLAKPENVGTESCMWKVTGPVDSDTMMQLYRTKRHKGSVLMAGLTQAAKDNMRAGQDLPPSVYRTLAHLFEMSRNGVPYTPLDCEGVKNGMSAASWARPLWTICEPSLPSASAPSGAEQEDEEGETGHEQGRHANGMDGCGGTLNEGAEGSEAEGEESGITDTQSTGQRYTASEEDTHLAVKLLNSAPAWCYLYSHEPLKSKKTPPKSSAHMVDMFKSGCLPEWTPLLGLRQEVAHFNSLPPSLFTTLGALLTVLQAGLELQPVGLVELQRYDKFIERRNHVGSTMRVPSSDSLHGSASGSILFKSRPLPSPGPVDGLSRAMSSLAPVANKAAATANGSSQHTAASCNSSTTGGATGVSPISHGTWAPSGGAVAGGDSPCSPVQVPAAMYPESPAAQGMVPPYGMPMQPQMQMYQAMLPTWLWGMPHMPYTLMASPGASPAAPHGMVTSPVACVPPSPTARRSGQGKRSSAGSRVGAAVPTSPAGVAAMAAVSSPGAASHRLGQAANLGHLSTGGARHGSGMLLTSPTASGPSAGGFPHGAAVSPHHVLMPADAAAAMQQAGMWGCWPTAAPMPAPVAPAPSGTSWSTSVFRLFMADCSRGMDVPVWWYLDHRAPNGLVGPLGCEAMIMAYASGTLTEQNVVCGTHSDVTAACPPAKEFFEELGGLLRQVEAGGQYVLVTLAEVTQHASLASSGGGSSSLGGASAGRHGGSSGKNSARKSKGTASSGSGSSGINSMSSAPVPPRTPTSATSPRQDIAGSLSDVHERWDPNGVTISPTGKGGKTSAARPGGANQRITPASPSTRRFTPGGGEQPLDTASATPAITTSAGGGGWKQQQQQRASNALARAAAVAALAQGAGNTNPSTVPAPTAPTASGDSCDDSHGDSAFTTSEAMEAAAAAVVSVRGDSRTASVGGATPRSESGRLSSCVGTRDQARKSSRGGTAPLSAKTSLEEDQTRALHDLIGLASGTVGEGLLRDSDDDVRGPAARDAHDSCNYSCGGGPGAVQVPEGPLPLVGVAPAIHVAQL